ncbi:hypothetical protein II906_09410, partial [bacterium]|nr:hypothetical protein [bacterium]
MNIDANRAGINYGKKKAGLPSERYYSQNLSFGASPVTLIQEAEKPVMDVFAQHYGNIGNRIGEKLGKLATESSILKGSARFSLEKGVSQIKDKNVIRALAENAIFPFVQLPLWTGSWVLKKAQMIPVMAEGAKKLYKTNFFRIPRKLNELDEKTDIIKGIYGKTKDTIGKFAKEKGMEPEKLTQMLNATYEDGKVPEIVTEAGEYIKENLYKVSNKFFDKHTGNFNTAFERPLNRIISGLIPVAFLANDAYNLSVLCGDSKEVSKREARERRKQEISRVFTTAYIQLLTFGAFTKYVNTIPWFTPLTSAATVLFSETNSRRRLGKPIFFLTKEKAKEYNKKQGNKTKQDHIDLCQAATSANSQPKYSMAYNKLPEEFASFSYKSINSSSFKAADDKNKQEQKPQEEKKALINAKTFKKALGIAIIGGLALSFIKNSSLTKNTKFVKGAYQLWDKIKEKIYNPVAFKDFTINKSSFDQIMGGLKEVGCEKVAEGHEFIAGKYAREAEKGVIKLYKRVLPKEKMGDIISTVREGIASTVNAGEKEGEIITQAVRTAISTEGVSVAEGKFSNVAKKALDIIKKKGINITEEQLPNLTEMISQTLQNNSQEAAIQVETKAKPFLDMLTEPFKFIGWVSTLPFKLIRSGINVAVSPIEKKAQKA